MNWEETDRMLDQISVAAGSVAMTAASARVHLRVRDRLKLVDMLHTLADEIERVIMVSDPLFEGVGPGVA
jgi:hypothetical protein